MAVAIGGISLHAVDVASGRPAQGIAVELVAQGERLQARGTPGVGGALDHPAARGEVPIADGTEHVHLPLEVTRWGLALFRGS